MSAIDLRVLPHEAVPMSAVAEPAAGATPDWDAPALRWARSGLMALCGRASGAPLVPDFDAMAGIEALLAWLEEAAAAHGIGLRGDVRWLSERAALMELSRAGRVSCNGSCRLIEARDGWVAVNLPRAWDLDCVPALVGGGEAEDPWSALERHARSRSVAELVAAGRLLGLAVAAADWPCRTGSPAPLHVHDAVQMHRIAPAGMPRSRDWAREPPLVVDLSALWAGPLCAQLLRRAGAHVVKVESTRRPDPVRGAAPAFHERLNAGKDSLVLDFAAASDRERLRALIAQADVVIGSARARAFEQLGLAPETTVAAHPRLCWVAITAHGWTGEARNAIGFGDDAAAAGGLLATDADGRPVFMGDALADPLTGIAAAAGAFAALAQGGGVIVDAALSRTAAFVAAGRRLASDERGQVVMRNGQWWLHVAGGSERVAAPRARAVSTHAHGVDTWPVSDGLATDCGAHGGIRAAEVHR